jgi:hypothetical protein
MMRRLAALVAPAALALAVGSAAPAAACPPPSVEVLFHSCWGDEARLAVALLPEDLPLPPAPEAGRRLVVTGAYTAREPRADGYPKPVGLFVQAGRVINPNLGRMDGVLITDPASGKPALHHRTRVPLGDGRYDLTRLEERRVFLDRAVAAGLSVLQSHLLIVDGRVDVREQEGAPAFVRRLLFTDADGFGIYQTTASLTLLEAAGQLAAEHAPRLALNLDMGSYDYCRIAEGGTETGCGLLGNVDPGKLSNLLVLSLE